MDESSSKRMVLDVSGLTLLVAASTWSRVSPLSSLLVTPLVFVVLVFGCLAWSVWRSRPQ